MSVRIERDNSQTISPNELRAGQIARIVSWGGGNTYDGMIVQRTYSDELVQIGGNTSWDDIHEVSQNSINKVSILSNNTVLTVENNE